MLSEAKTAPSASGKPRRTHVWFSRIVPVLPLLLGFLCLGLFDLSEDTDPPAVTEGAQLAPTRLVVLMVDSLDRRDVESSTSLPRLHARLANAGLHGPVHACVDAVTIPCVSAMITGFDRASSFSPLRNFGAARALAERSVLGALVKQGHRVGYFGDGLLARALEGLTMVRAYDHVDDRQAVDDALSALTQDNLDVVFVHLLSLDEAAHKFTASGEDYGTVLQRTDALLERAMRGLRADDHVVVLGDHGHAETGRHSAGMGTETYAAYFGPRFQNKLLRPLAMTDHARVWARLFGQRWGEPSWVDGYFDAVPDEQLVNEPAVLAVRRRSSLPLALVLLLALVLAAAGQGQALFSPRSWDRARVVALSVGLMVTLGLSVLITWLWPWLGSDLGALMLSALVGLLGAWVLRLWTAKPRHESGHAPLADVRERGVTGALLWALPTAEPTAGIKAPLLWLQLWLAGKLASSLRYHARTRAVSLLVCLLALFFLTLVRVRDYLPRLLFVDGAGPLLSVVLPSLLPVASVLCASGLRAGLFAALGCVLAQLVDPAASRWFMVPCALVFPLALLGFRRRALWSLLCLLVPITNACFFEQSSLQLLAITITWLLWALLPGLLREESLWLRASTFVLLMWLSFWATMSTRIGGIDYDFYFRWLPHNADATSEAVRQGLLTAAKCMLPTVFGALLASRAGALPLSIIKTAEHLTRVRLAVTIVFLFGLSLGRGAADLQLLYDATQEVAFWLLTVSVLGLIAAAVQVGKKEEETAADSSPSLSTTSPSG